MSTLADILETLKARGHRLTRARRAIVHVFVNRKAPLTVPEVQSLLGKKRIMVNRTTVYREVDFLTTEGVVREIYLGDGITRYELRPYRHHHHLVCLSCRSIECVDLEGCLEDEEKRISKESAFKILNHSLEFFGLCERCQ